MKLQMHDSECVEFLQWALPQMQMSWRGFRRVHKRVCKRLGRRVAELESIDLDGYRQHLENHSDEWRQLDRLCRVVVTRFYRDKIVFAEVAERVLPSLAAAAQAADKGTLHSWSIGSASGEEAYTLAILWYQLLAHRFPGVNISILGTEVDEQLIERSHRACYPAGTIKNLPEALRSTSFVPSNNKYCLRPHYHTMVHFRRQDIRSELPDRMFDFILCRNLVFTYFDETLQQRVLQRILTRLRPGGWLLVGVHESLPAHSDRLVAVHERLGLYRYE